MKKSSLKQIEQDIPRGKLIVVEGIDGTGKTTVTDMLLDIFNKEADVPLQKVNILRDAPASLQIRSIVTATPHPLHPTSEALLYMAAVLNTHHEKVLPLLEQGISVICDRSYLSTLAYQINDQKIAGNHIPAEIADLAYGSIQPDAIIMLFGQTEQTLARVQERDGKLDRIESRDRVYFKQIQSFYHEYRRRVEHNTPVYCYENIDGLAELQAFARSVAFKIAELFV